MIDTPCFVEGGELRRGTADRLSAGRERRHGTPPDCGVADEVRVLYGDPIHAPAVYGAARAVIGLVLEKQRLVLEEHRGVRQMERTLDGEDTAITMAQMRAGGVLSKLQYWQDTAYSRPFPRDLRCGLCHALLALCEWPRTSSEKNPRSSCGQAQNACPLPPLVDKTA